MKSKTLTVNQKRNLLVLLIKHKFDKRQKALDIEYNGLALDVYVDVISASLSMKMKKLPKGTVPDVGSIRVAFNGEQQYLRFPQGKSKLVPYHMLGKRFASYDRKHRLAIKYEELERAQMKLSREKTALGEEIKGLLGSVKTTKQLLDTWPEVKPFLLKILPPEKKPQNLPAIPVKKLNKALGLK